jgi:putative flippase GtrA
MYPSSPYLKYAKFLSAGIINSAVSYTLFLVFNIFCTYIVSFIISYIFGIGLGFILKSKVFLKQFIAKGKLSSYALANFINFTLSLILITSLVTFLQIPEFLAPLISLFMLFPLNFWLVRKSMGVKG